MFEVALFLAYWWMRATDQLGPILSSTGLIRGTGPPSEPQPAPPPRPPRSPSPRPSRPRPPWPGRRGPAAGILDWLGGVLNAAGGRGADWLDWFQQRRDELRDSWRRGVAAGRERRNAERPPPAVPAATPPEPAVTPIAAPSGATPPRLSLNKPLNQSRSATSPNTQGAAMTTPVESTFTADDIKIDDIEAFYRKVKADADVLMAGLTAENMDPKSIAELVEFADTGDSNLGNVLERHDAIREAVRNAEHAANTPVYTAR